MGGVSQGGQACRTCSIFLSTSYAIPTFCARLDDMMAMGCVYPFGRFFWQSPPTTGTGGKHCVIKTIAANQSKTIYKQCNDVMATNIN